MIFNEIQVFNFHISHVYRVATVREKCLENDFFQVGEKSGNFVDGQGNLERTWKVREKSGNLKINSYGSLQKIFVQKGKGCTCS